jgi:hypothetical protein
MYKKHTISCPLSLSVTSVVEPILFAVFAAGVPVGENELELDSKSGAEVKVLKL